MGKIKIALIFVGLALFSYLVYRAGPGEIYKELVSIGWGASLIIPPYFLVYVLDNYGFYFCFETQPGGGAGFWKLFTVRLAGDAVNYSTPTAYLGGEPVKAGLLTGAGIRLKDGLSAVIVSKTIMTMAQTLFLFIGLVLAMYVLKPSDELVRGTTIVLGCGFLIVAFMYWIQRRGMFGLFLKLLRSLKIRIKYIEEREGKFLELDDSLISFYTKRWQRFLVSMSFCLTGWLAGGLEVWVIARLIGVEISIQASIVVEMFIQTIKAAAFFMPANLGTQEVGNVFIFRAFGLDEKSAMSFSILRRAREIMWAAAGFYFLAKLAPAEGEGTGSEIT